MRHSDGLTLLWCCTAFEQYACNIGIVTFVRAKENRRKFSFFFFTKNRSLNPLYANACTYAILLLFFFFVFHAPSIRSAIPKNRSRVGRTRRTDGELENKKWKDINNPFRFWPRPVSAVFSRSGLYEQ